MAGIRVVAVLIAAALLGGCGHAAPAAQPSASSSPTAVRLADNADRPLLDTRWVVVKRTHNGTSTDVPAGVAYVIFSRTGLVGITGCSGLAATITVHDGQMTVEPVHRSDVPCDGPVAELDAAVMATLTGTVRYRIAGAELSLSGPDGNGLTLKAQDAVGPTQSPPSTELPGGGPMSGMNGGMG